MKNLFVLATFAIALASTATVAPAAAANGDDPCTTVSKSDVAVALKGPVATADSKPRGLSHVCTFKGGALMSTVTVTASRGNSVDDITKQYATLTGRMAKIYPPVMAVSGVGDAAIGIRTAVYVRKGTAMYVFDVLGRQGPETLARAAALAKATMPHINDK